MIYNFNRSVRESYSSLAALLKQSMLDIYVVTKEQKSCGMIKYLYWSKVELRHHCDDKWCSVCHSKPIHVASETTIKTNVAGEIIKE